MIMLPKIKKFNISVARSTFAALKGTVLERHDGHLDTYSNNKQLRQLWFN